MWPRHLERFPLLRQSRLVLAFPDVLRLVPSGTRFDQPWPPVAHSPTHKPAVRCRTLSRNIRERRGKRVIITGPGTVLLEVGSFVRARCSRQQCGDGDESFGPGCVLACCPNELDGGAGQPAAEHSHWRCFPANCLVRRFRRTVSTAERRPSAAARFRVRALALAVAACVATGVALA